MFRKAVSYSKAHSRTARVKYLHKYARKRAKLGLPPCSADDGALANRLATAVLDSPRMEQVRHSLDHESEHLDEMLVFALNLHAAIELNAGLEHSKVREYWLLRGPRFLATTCSLLALSIVFRETLTSPTHEERLNYVLLSMVALLASAYMIYCRLSDAILSSIMRSAHDSYVRQKQSMRLEQFGDLHV